MAPPQQQSGEPEETTEQHGDPNPPSSIPARQSLEDAAQEHQPRSPTQSLRNQAFREFHSDLAVAALHIALPDLE